MDFFFVILWTTNIFIQTKSRIFPYGHWASSPPLVLKHTHISDIVLYVYIMCNKSVDLHGPLGRHWTNIRSTSSNSVMHSLLKYLLILAECLFIYSRKWNTTTRVTPCEGARLHACEYNTLPSHCWLGVLVEAKADGMPWITSSACNGCPKFAIVEW